MIHSGDAPPERLNPPPHQGCKKSCPRLINKSQSGAAPFRTAPVLVYFTFLPGGTDGSANRCLTHQRITAGRKRSKPSIVKDLIFDGPPAGSGF